MRHLRLSSRPMLAATALLIAGALAPVLVTAQAQQSTQSPVPAQPPSAARTVQTRTGHAAAGDERSKLRRLPQAARPNRPAEGSHRARSSGCFELLLGSGRHGCGRQEQIGDRQSREGTEPEWIRCVGLEAIIAYAAESTIMPDPQRKGVFCAPAEPAFDDQAADELANTTHTDASDWAFPVRDGIEVRATPKQDAPVVDKLGMYLIRILSNDFPANAVMATSVKVMTPSGKEGYVPIDTVLPLGGEQLCYLKEASGWKIAGFRGGELNQ